MKKNETHPPLATMLLKKLAEASCPLDLTTLHHSHGQLAIAGRELLAEILISLQAAGYVYRDGPAWGVTGIGRKMSDIMSGDAELPTPAQTVSEALDERVKAYHDEKLASFATVCLGEPELDNWWDEQDVSEKADIFLLWTMGATATRAELRADTVPVEGAVNSLEAA